MIDSALQSYELNDLHAKIAELVQQILEAEKCGDYDKCNELLRERTRLQRLVRASLGSFSAFDCQHEETELRRRTINGGTKILQRQCKACGSSVGNAASKQNMSVEELAAVPKWDEGLQSLREVQRLKHSVEQQTRTDKWWTWYNTYLESPEWKAKARAVRLRDNNICQGCRIAPAVDVHHLTYDHAGFELLFELISVCKECHGVCHGPKSQLGR